MFFRFLQGLTLATMLFGVFTPAVSAADNLWTSSLLPDQVSADTNQTTIAPADESDTFFNDSYVHEIYLTFDDADYGTAGWYNTLYDSHANDPDDPYFPASFSGDGVTINSVGVRFKGNSSFNANGIKKIFQD